MLAPVSILSNGIDPGRLLPTPQPEHPPPNNAPEVSCLWVEILPALSRAKSAAHKAVCISNQRQIGIARQLYADDNGGALIPLIFSKDQIRFDSFWNSDFCFGYLGGQTNLFDCPAEKRIPRLVAMGKVRPGWWGWGYQQNALGVHNNRGNRFGTDKEPHWGISGSTYFDSLRESAVLSPSRMIEQGDASRFAG